jgi:hypothetical protein
MLITSRLVRYFAVLEWFEVAQQVNVSGIFLSISSSSDKEYNLHSVLCFLILYLLFNMNTNGKQIL